MTNPDHQSTKPVPESDRSPLPVVAAVVAVIKCALTTVRLLVRRQIRQPSEHVDDVLQFADGSFARVYRETTIPRDHVGEPTALVVEFRLRWVRGRGHAWFRAESLLNTPLFVGFPGFASKLWLAHDQAGFYRGVYEWDGSELAHAYARALWWILALVSERDSIHYIVLPGRTRAAFLVGDTACADDAPWWRVTGVTRAERSSAQSD
jgi:hypothetical protein